MSWEIFRCNLATPTDDCTDKTTTNCISEALYQGQVCGVCEYCTSLKINEADTRRFELLPTVYQVCYPTHFMLPPLLIFDSIRFHPLVSFDFRSAAAA